MEEVIGTDLMALGDKVVILLALVIFASERPVGNRVVILVFRLNEIFLCNLFEDCVDELIFLW